MKWRTKLSCHNFNICYCPRAERDTLLWAFCATFSLAGDLSKLHDSLCQPVVTRMFHFAKKRNLQYSIEEVRQMARSCQVCAELKTQVYLPAQSHLIKATQQFQQLNINFKGPLESNYNNTYFLNIIDENSRFPLVFSYKDVITTSVIQCLCQLFSLHRMLAYIHSDMGSSLMSQEFVSSKA